MTLTVLVSSLLFIRSLLDCCLRGEEGESSGVVMEEDDSIDSRDAGPPASGASDIELQKLDTLHLHDAPTESQQSQQQQQQVSVVVAVPGVLWDPSPLSRALALLCTSLLLFGSYFAYDSISALSESLRTFRRHSLTRSLEY